MVLADAVEEVEVRKHKQGLEQKLKRMIVGIEVGIGLYVSACAETLIDQRLTFFCRSTRCLLTE